MTKIEAAKYILKLWMDKDYGADNFHAQWVMFRLVCLGYPAKTAEILMVARAYCDSETENKTYGHR